MRELLQHYERRFDDLTAMSPGVAEGSNLLGVKIQPGSDRVAVDVRNVGLGLIGTSVRVLVVGVHSGVKYWHFLQREPQPCCDDQHRGGGVCTTLTRWAVAPVIPRGRLQTVTPCGRHS